MNPGRVLSVTLSSKATLETRGTTRREPLYRGHRGRRRTGSKPTGGSRLEVYRPGDRIPSLDSIALVPGFTALEAPPAWGVEVGHGHVRDASAAVAITGSRLQCGFDVDILTRTRRRSTIDHLPGTIRRGRWSRREHCASRYVVTPGREQGGDRWFPPTVPDPGLSLRLSSVDPRIFYPGSPAGVQARRARDRYRNPRGSVGLCRARL